MGFDRRAFVNGLAVVGAGLAPTGFAQSAEPRNGRAPITRKELDGIVGSIFGSGLTCVETTQETEGPFYYESSLQRRSLVEGQHGVPLRARCKAA